MNPNFLSGSCNQSTYSGPSRCDNKLLCARSARWAPTPCRTRENQNNLDIINHFKTANRMKTTKKSCVKCCSPNEMVKLKAFPEETKPRNLHRRSDCVFRQMLNGFAQKWETQKWVIRTLPEAIRNSTFLLFRKSSFIRLSVSRRELDKPFSMS